MNSAGSAGVPTGIRTPVIAVKGRCPRPLDDGDFKTQKLFIKTAFHALLTKPEELVNRAKSGGGGKRDRTADLLHAMQALSQLSYTPTGQLNFGRAVVQCGAHYAVGCGECKERGRKIFHNRSQGIL